MNTVFPFSKNKVRIELTPKNDVEWEVTLPGNDNGITITTPTEDLWDGEN